MENDLISRVELRRQLAIWCEKLRSAGECGGCEVELLQAVIKMVDAQAAVDTEPVRHGKWEDNAYIWKCGSCHKWLLVEDGDADMNYCPNCGAKMDGRTDDGQIA